MIRAALPLLFVLVCSPGAKAEPFYVPIDGSDARYSARDFGYQLKVTPTGDRCYVHLELDSAAARSYTGSLLALYRGGDLLVDTNLGLVADEVGKRQVLRFAFDPRVITSGELIIHSKTIPDHLAVINFGGLKLSVERILALGYPGNALEEIRKESVKPDSKDSTKRLLGYLQSKDAFVRAQAIDLLGERKARAAIPQLIKLLADGTALIGSDNWVGSHAAAALSKITGRPFDVDQQAWRKWWKEQKPSGS